MSVGIVVDTQALAPDERGIHVEIMLVDTVPGSVVIDLVEKTERDVEVDTPVCVAVADEVHDAIAIVNDNKNGVTDVNA